MGSETTRRQGIDAVHELRNGGDHGNSGEHFGENPGENSGASAAESSVEAIQWIAGHCRFVTTRLPRGELGVRFAARLLAAVPEACRRRVPDLTGTGPELVDRCVDFGLLTEVPSPRVVRAGLRLLAARTPILEARGARSWTLWLVHLREPGILARIQRRTPASQLEICAPPPTTPRARRRSRGELLAELEALQSALAIERSQRADLERRWLELSGALAAKSATLDRLLLEAAALAEENASLTTERDHLRQLKSEHHELLITHRRALAEVKLLKKEVEPLHAENERLEAELEQALTQSEHLSRQLLRHERAGELGAAVVALGKTLLRGRGGIPEEDPDR